MNCHLLLFSATTMNPFSIRLWRTMKSGFYMTAGDDQLSGWTEKKLQSTSQSQTCTKKRSWSLVACCWSDPLQLSESWILVKPLYLRSMLSKSMKSPKTAAGICQQKGPSSSPWQHLTKGCTTKSWRNWAMKFCLTHHSHLTLANRLLLLQASWQLFAGKTPPQPAGCRKCFPRVRKILKHQFLCYGNKQTYF